MVEVEGDGGVREARLGKWRGLLVIQEAASIGVIRRIVGLGSRKLLGAVIDKTKAESKSNRRCDGIIRVRESGRGRRVTVSYRIRLLMRMAMSPAGRCGRGRSPADLGVRLVHEAQFDDCVGIGSRELALLLSLEARRGTFRVSLPGTVAVL